MSVKVAEKLNTHVFVEQSKYEKTNDVPNASSNFEEFQNKNFKQIAEQTVKMAESFQPKSTNLQT